jgi:hypothetical protein
MVTMQKPVNHCKTKTLQTPLNKLAHASGKNGVFTCECYYEGLNSVLAGPGGESFAVRGNARNLPPLTFNLG